MNILIVEDDQLLAEQLTESLRENGHETVHIDDGVKGEAEARRTAYDVMIVDRMMPGQDGLAMISALRGRRGQHADLDLVGSRAGRRPG